jgi:predicted negative regulator of RcsB-dependent stress response
MCAIPFHEPDCISSGKGCRAVFDKPVGWDFGLPFVGGRENLALIMQTQDVSAEIAFKFWPWFEANRQRLIIAAVALVVAFFVWFFISTQRAQKEIAAGQAYTQLMLNPPAGSSPQQAVDGYLQLAKQYAGTVAAERALLQAASVQFMGGRYAEAQAQFQSFVTANAGSALVATAKAGIAASLESLGKLDEALAAYRAVSTGYPDSNEAVTAKFAVGRILELQGKLSEAVTAYQEVTRLPVAGSLAQEAGQRIALLQVKIAAIKPAAPIAPATKS